MDLCSDPLRVAITGHTSGIGRAFCKWFENQGHTVIGLSRSNGNDTKDIEHIVNEVKNCDVFVNNAWQRFDQTELLYHVHHVWRGDQNKLIIAVNSSTTLRPTWYDDDDPEHNMYKTSKQSLDLACGHLRNHDPWPRIVTFRPGHTDTAMTKSSDRPKMAPEVLIDYFMSCIIKAPQGMFIQEICIREQHDRHHIRNTQ